MLAEARSQYRNARFLVIVGNDEIIPYRRVADLVAISPERKYAPDALVSPNNATYAALAQGFGGHMLTDDFYTDEKPVCFLGHHLYIPDHPSGRLVETPGEIINTIRTFRALGGRLVAQTSLSTGYDFLTDGAEQIANNFDNQGLVNTRLISDVWTRADLIANFLSIPHDLNSINAHFQHWRAAPATGLPPLFTVKDLLSGPANPGSVVSSMGCHAGLSIPDPFNTNPQASQDFCQAFSSRGTVYVANTGYGYGMDDAVALTEKLVADFSRVVGVATGVAVVGDAHVTAKHEYLHDIAGGSFSIYDEKVLIVNTLYGLPMYEVSTPQGTGEPRQVEYSSELSEWGDLIVNSVVISPTFEVVAVDSNEARGSYYTVLGQAQVNAGRPIQPRASVDITLPTGYTVSQTGAGRTVAHGALFTGGHYTDKPGTDPVIARPVTETVKSHYEPAFDFDGWYPRQLPAINRLTTADGVSERLVVMAGQYRNNESGLADRPAAQTDQGIQRLYDRMAFEVYYSSSEDFSPPTIIRAEAIRNPVNGAIHFSVRASDDQSQVERVTVTYAREGSGEWKTLDLDFRLTEGRWMGTLTDRGALEYFAQAVDSAGNVALSGGKGLHFQPTTCPDVNGDRQINITDIQIVAVHWGKTSTDQDWTDAKDLDLMETRPSLSLTSCL